MSEPLLRTEGLTRHFRVGKLFSRQRLHAVDDVSFEIGRGEIVALVGESGSGKSTIARLLALVYQPTRGEVMVHGKAKREESLPLPVDVGEALVDWFKRGRPECAIPYVFTRVRAPFGGLSSGGVSAVVRQACGRAGLPVMGAHRLRHSAATQMLRAGGSLEEVGQVLRHRGRDTTSIYAKVDRDSLSALIQRWPGGAA